MAVTPNAAPTGKPTSRDSLLLQTLLQQRQSHRSDGRATSSFHTRSPGAYQQLHSDDIQYPSKPPPSSAYVNRTRSLPRQGHSSVPANAADAARAETYEEMRLMLCELAARGVTLPTHVPWRQESVVTHLQMAGRHLWRAIFIGLCPRCLRYLFQPRPKTEPSVTLTPTPTPSLTLALTLTLALALTLALTLAPTLALTLTLTLTAI